MQEVRCPDCGYRLKTNECPICCKRVPFPAVTRQKTAQKPKQLRNFEVPFPKTAGNRRRQGSGNPKVKVISAVAAVVFAVFPLIGEILGDIELGTREPEYPAYYEEFIEAGTAGAANIPALEQQVIFDDYGMVITANCLGLIYDSPALSLTIANESERNVSVMCDFVEVNGFMLASSGMFCETAAGETLQTYIRLDEESLNAAGIDTIANVTLSLDIYDDEDYSDLAEDLQIRLETSAAGHVQSVDDSGTVVYDAGGVRLIFKGMEVDTYGDATLRFFAENLTEHTVNIGADMVYLNDRETDGMLWCHLWPDTRSNEQVYIWELSEYGIDTGSDIEQVRLELYVQNAENWESVYETIIIDLTK